MLKVISKSILLLVLTLILSFSPSLTFAESPETMKPVIEQVNPGSFYYNFKRLWEKTREKLLFSSTQKKEYYQYLLDIRFSELNFVVDHKLLGEVQGASERFAYQAGVLTNLLEKEGKAEDKSALREKFMKYSSPLDVLRDKYPSNSSFWMLIQHDINTLNILADRIK